MEKALIHNGMPGGQAPQSPHNRMETPYIAMLLDQVSSSFGQQVDITLQL